jgi:hypothetical protein
MHEAVGVPFDNQQPEMRRALMQINSWMPYA